MTDQQRPSGGLEDVRISESFSGPVKARVLWIESGVVADVTASVEDRAEIAGEGFGRVIAPEVEILPGGSFDGEIHADTIRLAGRFKGVLRARNLLFVKGSAFAGSAVADRFGCSADAVIDGVVASGPGNFDRPEMLSKARRYVASTETPSESTQPFNIAPGVDIHPSVIAAVEDAIRTPISAPMDDASDQGIGSPVASAPMAYVRPTKLEAVRTDSQAVATSRTPVFGGSLAERLASMRDRMPGVVTETEDDVFAGLDFAVERLETAAPKAIREEQCDEPDETPVPFLVRKTRQQVSK